MKKCPTGVFLRGRSSRLLLAYSRHAALPCASISSDSSRRSAGTNPGQRVTNNRPVVRESDETSWADLIAVPAERDPQVHTTTLQYNRLRQLKSALRTLASDEVELIELPHDGASKRWFENFHLLREPSTPPRATTVRYKVPTESTPSLPSLFFLNGWVYALDKAEIALYLMLQDLRWRYPGVHHQEGVYIRKGNRLRFYGLSKDTYKSYHMLARLGLLEIRPDSRRRQDGTVEGGLDRDHPPLPHRFRLLDEGLEELAIPIILDALTDFAMNTQ